MMVQLAVRLPVECVERLDVVAAGRRWSRAQAIRELLLDVLLREPPVEAPDLWAAAAVTRDLDALAAQATKKPAPVVAVVPDPLPALRQVIVDKGGERKHSKRFPASSSCQWCGASAGVNGSWGKDRCE